MRLAEQMRQQEAKRAEMMAELQKMLKYSHYLEAVLGTEAEFGEITDILARRSAASR